MEVISASKAKWILRKHLKSRIFWTRKVLLFNGEYGLVNEASLNLTPVRLERSDCDERAFVMFTNVIKQQPSALFGFVEGYNTHGLKHAWVFFIRGDQQVRYAEPSTAEIFSPTTERVYHFIR